MAAIDGEHVRILRVRNGESATDFAGRIGISLSYLGDIETGRRTLKRNPALIKRIADELKVPISMIEHRASEVAS
jgi:transcriptional regulator with XRE-family HTH domain